MKFEGTRIDYVQTNFISLYEKRVHHLKTVNPFYLMTSLAKKTFEVRKDDRDFNGDEFLMLWEYDEGFTGHCELVYVGYLLRDFPGVEPGYCVMSTSIFRCSESDILKAALISMIKTGKKLDNNIIETYC